MGKCLLGVGLVAAVVRVQEPDCNMTASRLEHTKQGKKPHRTGELVAQEEGEGVEQGVN